MKAQDGVAARLSLLYAVQFAIFGVHSPFFPLWLTSRGLSADVVGLLLALPILVRASSAYAVAGLADRRIGALRLLGILGAANALVWPLLIGFDSLSVILFVTVATALLMAALVPLVDTVALDAADGTERLYGRVRIWGSIGFLVTMIGAGKILDLAGPDIVPALIAGVAAMGAAVAFSSPGLAASSEKRRRRAAETTRTPLPKPFLFAAAGIACVQASHAVVNGFAPILWTRAGMDGLTVAVLLGIGVVAEIFFLLRFGRTGPGAPVFGLLVIGAAAAILRWLLTAIGPGVVITAALQTLHALSFGATLVATVAAARTLVPEAERARAQGLVAATTAGASAAATALSGRFVDAFGTGTFALMAPLAAAGLVLILVARRCAQPQSAGEGGKTTLSS